MSANWEPDREPTLETLAAYFDGELAPQERAEVEVWLDSHPEGRAELESLRQLHAAYDGLVIPELTQESWDSTLARIRVELARTRPHRRGNWAWLWLLTSASAAAILGVLFIRPEPKPAKELPVEPFPVVSAGDVLVISMNPNDREALVIVEPLELQEIDLATHNEVDILGGENQGMMRIDDWASPMIVDPLAYAGPR